MTERLDREILRSHEQLEAMLQAADVPATLGERARWGLELTLGGDGQSKLGGRPDLPGAWPLNAGHGLTHLASIALGELPEFEGRDLLPAGGTLVFFADFHPDTEDEAHQVLYVPDGVATRPAEPPDEVRHWRVVPVELPERRISFAPCLTLPALEVLNAGADAFARLTADLGYPTHLILGHPIFIQGEEPGGLNLLHLGWDEDWGFEYADGGQITFHLEAGDLRAGRWERAEALYESS